MQREGHCGLKVENCGVFVAKNHGFLDASPDALVTNPSIENRPRSNRGKECHC